MVLLGVISFPFYFLRHELTQITEFLTLQNPRQELLTIRAFQILQNLLIFELI